ncbi:MAG: hypothetical protein ABI615_01285 [Chthoniobacterales bacterium]
MDDSSAASPAKSAIEELEFLRQNFRTTVDSYAARVEGEIAHIQEIIRTEADGEKVSAAKIRDLRDMLSILRNLDTKPEKGRRKDLKKLDLLVVDLTALIENW